MGFRPFGGFDKLSHRSHRRYLSLSLSRCLSSELVEESKAKPSYRIPLKTPVISQYSHLSALLSFSCSNLEFAFRGKRHHQFYRILQNTTVLRVVFFWYGLLLRHIGAEKYATRGFWCYLYSSCHLHSVVCTCNLSWKLK